MALLKRDSRNVAIGLVSLFALSASGLMVSAQPADPPGKASPTQGAAARAATTPLGRWENTHTKVVLEFSDDGAVRMSGATTATFKMCGDNGGNICITGEGFTCRYRAKFDGPSMRLQLFTGRPTKNCPEGVFQQRS